MIFQDVKKPIWGVGVRNNLYQTNNMKLHLKYTVNFMFINVLESQNLQYGSRKSKTLFLCLLHRDLTKNFDLFRQ